MKCLYLFLLFVCHSNKAINYISYFVFPLEELFSDLYPAILYNEPAIMREALRCYSELEASQRDYSQKISIDYVPMDPYGKE